MADPLPEIPEMPGKPDVGGELFERAEQAKRFVDLARQHALEIGEPTELNPLIAARLHDAMAAEGSATPEARGSGDAFGDGNGFGAGTPFGIDETPLDPFD